MGIINFEEVKERRGSKGKALEQKYIEYENRASLQVQKSRYRYQNGIQRRKHLRNIEF